jgi:cytochrome oxidase Cu insertion factor (SCO1/SenC/PrrC family)
MSGSNSSAPGSIGTAPEPLTFTVHSMPAPGLEDQRRTTRGRWQMLLVLLVCAAPVIASYFTYYVIRPSARTNYGELIEPNRPLPTAAQLQLQDLQRQPVDPATLRGQWLLIVVAEGGCDDRCEELLYAQRQLREALGREKDRLDRVWLVTGDTPVRPDLLPAMQQATVLYAPWQSLVQWLQPAPGESLQNHLYVVDPMGRWMMRFPSRPQPGKVKRDIERLLRASASWDTAGR